MAGNKKNNKQRRSWFQSFGWFYLPMTWAGALVMALAFAFCLSVFLLIDTHAQSLSELLYALFPYLACSFLLVDWIAGKSSKNSKP
jgi:hypothetical protein